MKCKLLFVSLFVTIDGLFSLTNVNYTQKVNSDIGNITIETVRDVQFGRSFIWLYRDLPNVFVSYFWVEIYQIIN